jgi:hypothetical protein
MRTLILALALVQVVPVRGGAQQPVQPFGCYRLTTRDWVPRPSRIHLDSVIVRLDSVAPDLHPRVRSDARRLQPSAAELGVPPFGDAIPANWTNDAGALTLEWRSQIQGIRIVGRVQNDTLRGRVNHSSDGVDVRYPQGPSATVIAARTPCPH